MDLLVIASSDFTNVELATRILESYIDESMRPLFVYSDNAVVIDALTKLTLTSSKIYLSSSAELDKYHEVMALWNGKDDECAKRIRKCKRNKQHVNIRVSWLFEYGGKYYKETE